MTRLPTANGAAVAREVAAELRGRWWLLALVVLVLTAGAASGLVAPAVLGQVVDEIQSGTGTVGLLWGWGLLMLAAALIGAAATAAGVVIAARLYEVVVAQLRERMVSHAFQLPQRVVEAAGSGDLVSRATDDVAEISQAAPRIVPVLTRSFFTVVVTLVGMALVDYRYALALLVLLPVHALAVRYYLRHAPQVYVAQRAAMAERAQHLLTSLHGLETVRAYRLEEQHLRRITAASWQVVRWNLLARIVQNRFFGRLNLAEFLGTAALLVVGYLLVASGHGTLGGATTAVLFFLRLFDPINGLLMVIDDVQSAFASLARIVGVLRTPVHASTAAGSSAPRGTSGQLAAAPVLDLDAVDFAYRGDHPVLVGVDLQVRAGQTVALVGESGAGKSTIAALAAGILRPDRGTVRTATTALPGQVLLVTQETHTFSGTLRANLTLVAPDAEDSRLRAAIDAVGAGDLLDRLPDGLDTLVGDDGHRLTAAEAQLLALVRVQLADPELVILDEATAEAGSAAAGQLDAATAAVLADRAGLVIAHRLSQARECDRIAVIDHGRIVEEGTHTELVAAGGRYTAMWAAWTHTRPAPSPPRG